MKLLHMWTTTLACGDRLHSNDLNRRGPCPVPGSHITVYKMEEVNKYQGSQEHTLGFSRTALCDCSRDGEIPVLTIHVVCATARVIAEPYTNVLDPHGGGVSHLDRHTEGNANDLTVVDY